MKWLCIVPISIFICRGAILSVKANNAENIEATLYYDQFNKLMEGIQKLTIGTGFLVSSIMSNIRMKTYFPKFFYKNKYLIRFSMFGLTLPLYMTGGIYISFWTKAGNKYWHNMLTAVFNIIVYISSFVLPITF